MKKNKAGKLLIKTLFFLTTITIFSFSFSSQAWALSIDNINQSSSIVNLYEKLEVSFNVNEVAASNLQFSYDAQEIAGLTSRIGISVDGLFLPPGESDWANALIQPAFLFQPTLKDTSIGGAVSEWVYPAGDAYWMIRFSPQIEGNWQYKIRVQDSSICSAGVDPCPNWLESGIDSFQADSAQADNHGFIKISPNDFRYFEFSDGRPFIGVGHQIGIQIEKKAKQDFQLYQAHKVNYFRSWMSSFLIFSVGTHDWDPWREAKNKRSIEEVEDNDFSIKLSGNGDYIFQTIDGNQYITGGLEAGKTYKVKIRAKLVDVIPTLGEGRKGLIAKLTRGTSFSGTTVLNLTDGFSGDTDWQTFESTFTNTLGRIIFRWENVLMVGLQDVISGTAYIDEIYIGEDLGGGQIGPNVVFKGKMNYHQYYDPLSSAHWDEIFTSAEANKVYLQPVILDKDDKILGRIRLADGIFDPSILHSESQTRWNNFYAEPNTKVRRLQEYFWRYLAARWGYSTSVHSWELLNEGDRNNGRHREQTNALCKFMKENNPSRQLAGTSNWAGFSVSQWTDPQYPDITHADLHGYNNSSGSFHFNVPELDDPQLAIDMALFHINYSKWAFDQGVEKPIIRGEAGICGNGQTSNVSETLELANDVNGVWLHNYLWSGLDPWGLYELYWWTSNIRTKPGPDGNSSNGLYEIYTPFVEFMNDISLTNGRYQDIEAVVSSPNARVWGQKDNKDGGFADHAHLWIQNQNHTWKKVVDSQSWGSLQGTISLAGFAPNNTYSIEWWQFDNNVVLTKREGETIASNSSGEIVLELESLSSTVTDVGVKIGDYSLVEYQKGDVNQDGTVDFNDALLILRNWGGAGSEDVNSDGKVNSIDIGWVIKNWGS